MSREEPMRADEIVWEIEKLEDCLRLEDRKNMRANYRMRIGKLRLKLQVLQRREKRTVAKAFVAGWDARVTNRPKEINPYTQPLERDGWLKGWNACDRGEKFPEELRDI